MENFPSIPTVRLIKKSQMRRTIMQNKLYYYAILFLMSTALLTGCSLPNLKPFADATAELHTAILETDSNVRKTLTKAGAQRKAQEIGKELAVRITAMKAVVNYTDSLANITEAGRTGSDNAGKLAGAVDGFLGALSAPTLPSNYVAIAKSLYGIVANVRAAHSFSQALKKADPAIQAMAEILIADFDALESLLAQSAVPVQLSLLSKNNNNEIVDYRTQLDKKRRQLEKDLSANLSDAKKIKEIKEINALIEMTRDRYDPYIMQLNAIKQGINSQISLVIKSRDGIRQWADIHAGLATSVKDGLPPNTRLLAATVIEIRKLIKEEKKL
jgi:hypothetical protein